MAVQTSLYQAKSRDKNGISAVVIETNGQMGDFLSELNAVNDKSVKSVKGTFDVLTLDKLRDGGVIEDGNQGRKVSLSSKYVQVFRTELTLGYKNEGHHFDFYLPCFHSALRLATRTVDTVWAGEEAGGVNSS